MTPEAEAVLHFEIGRVITGLSVQPVGAAVRFRWGVFDSRGGSSKWLTEPLPYLEAIAERTRLQTEAILQLIKELAPDARAAD